MAMPMGYQGHQPSLLAQLADRMRDARTTTWDNPTLLLAMRKYLRECSQACQPKWLIDMGNHESFVNVLADLMGHGERLDVQLDISLEREDFAEAVLAALQSMARSLLNAADHRARTVKSAYVFAGFKLQVERREFCIHLRAITTIAPLVHPTLRPPALETPASPFLAKMGQRSKRVLQFTETD